MNEENTSQQPKEEKFNNVSRIGTLFLKWEALIKLSKLETVTQLLFWL